MTTFRVHQIRSGEGWILTEPSNLSAEALADELADLVTGVMLVSSVDFVSGAPSGGEKVAPGLFAFRGDAAKAMLRDWKRWGGRRAIFAIVPAVPDEDARRKWIADALRPWDAERLKASVYGQLGSEWAQRGLWFAGERERGLFLNAAVRKLLADRGARMPNGDVSIVLELPTDSTFDARFDVSGSGKDVVLRRDFPSRLMSREWSIRSGDWEALERTSASKSGKSFRERAVQALATVGILVVSIPTFLMVLAVALIAKLTGSATTVSTSTKATTR